MTLAVPDSDSASHPARRTQVHPLETNVEQQSNWPSALCDGASPQSDARPPRRDLPDVEFRHSCWHPTRVRVWRALQEANASQSRLDSFETCGLHAWVLESTTNPGQYRVASDKCHDRFCLMCGNERSRIIAANVIARLRGKPARFLTLTLRSRQEPLADTITRLYKSFARLRQRRLWKRSVTGGVAFLEVKRSNDCNHWHVHLHALLQGKYLNSRELSRTWKQITTDSYIVDIRIVRDESAATRYVAKYASKPLDPTATRQHHALTEAIIALRGRRLCLTFGTWRGVVLTESTDTDEWEAVAPLSELLQRAAAGDGSARKILNALTGAQTCKQSRSPPTNCTRGEARGQQRFDWTERQCAPTAVPF